MQKLLHIFKKKTPIELFHFFIFNLIYSEITPFNFYNQHITYTHHAKKINRIIGYFEI